MIQVTRRQGRRSKKLPDDIKDRRGYCHLKEEAVDRNMWWDRLEEALNLSSDVDTYTPLYGLKMVFKSRNVSP